jgi:hypothetical protein
MAIESIAPTDELFGPYRVTTHYADFEDRLAWMKEMDKRAEWCAEQDFENMITFPGLLLGDTVWCFTSERDAVHFALKWQ